MKYNLYIDNLDQKLIAAYINDQDWNSLNLDAVFKARNNY